MTQKELEAKLAKLIAENESLRQEATTAVAKQKTRSVSLKVSEKGCISVYGIRRNPLSYYPNEWIKIALILREVEELINSKPEGMSLRDVHLPVKLVG